VRVFSLSESLQHVGELYVLRRRVETDDLPVRVRLLRRRLGVELRDVPLRQVRRDVAVAAVLVPPVEVDPELRRRVLPLQGRPGDVVAAGAPGQGERGLPGRPAD